MKKRFWFAMFAIMLMFFAVPLAACERRKVTPPQDPNPPSVTDPENPGDKEEPENPENPDNPNNPENPDNPNKPENPDNPNLPADTEFTFSFTVDIGGSVIIFDSNYNLIEEETSLKAGTLITLMAIEEIEGYTFSGFYAGTTLLSNETTYVHTLTNDIEISVKFEAPTVFYNFSVIPEAGGSVIVYDVNQNISTQSKYEEGTTLTLVAYENNDYTFNGYYINNILISKDKSYNITLDKDTTIVAKFDEVLYGNVNVIVSGLGFGEIVGDVTRYRVGDTCYLHAEKTVDHYEFIGWKQGVMSISNEMDCSFVVEGDTTVTAEFRTSALHILDRVMGGAYNKFAYFPQTTSEYYNFNASTEFQVGIELENVSYIYTVSLDANIDLLGYNTEIKLELKDDANSKFLLGVYYIDSENGAKLYLNIADKTKLNYNFISIPDVVDIIELLVNGELPEEGKSVAAHGDTWTLQSVLRTVLSGLDSSITDIIMGVVENYVGASNKLYLFSNFVWEDDHASFDLSISSLLTSLDGLLSNFNINIDIIDTIFEIFTSNYQGVALPDLSLRVYANFDNSKPKETLEGFDIRLVLADDYILNVGSIVRLYPEIFGLEIFENIIIDDMLTAPKFTIFATLNHLYMTHIEDEYTQIFNRNKDGSLSEFANYESEINLINITVGGEVAFLSSSTDENNDTTFASNNEFYIELYADLNPFAVLPAIKRNEEGIKFDIGSINFASLGVMNLRIYDKTTGNDFINLLLNNDKVSVYAKFLSDINVDLTYSNFESLASGVVGDVKLSTELSTTFDIQSLLEYFGLITPETPSIPDPEPPHEHTFEQGWTTNETKHWHKASCEHSDLISDEGEHTFNGDICSVCGYTKPEHEHTYNTSSWSYDADSHYHASTCGHSGLVIDKTSHTFDGDTCTVCGYVKPPEHVHTYSEEWTYDENNHWHASSCGHDVTDGSEAHSFDGDVCTVCGYTKEPSKLDYYIELVKFILPYAKTLIEGTNILELGNNLINDLVDKGYIAEDSGFYQFYKQNFNFSSEFGLVFNIGQYKENLKLKDMVVMNSSALTVTANVDIYTAIFGTSDALALNLTRFSYGTFHPYETYIDSLEVNYNSVVDKFNSHRVITDTTSINGVTNYNSLGVGSKVNANVTLSTGEKTTYDMRVIKVNSSEIDENGYKTTTFYLTKYKIEETKNIVNVTTVDIPSVETVLYDNMKIPFGVYTYTVKFFVTEDAQFEIRTENAENYNKLVPYLTTNFYTEFKDLVYGEVEGNYIPVSSMDLYYEASTGSGGNGGTIKNTIAISEGNAYASEFSSGNSVIYKVKTLRLTYHFITGENGETVDYTLDLSPLACLYATQNYFTRTDSFDTSATILATVSFVHGETVNINGSTVEFTDFDGLYSSRKTFSAGTHNVKFIYGGTEYTLAMFILTDRFIPNLDIDTSVSFGDVPEIKAAGGKVKLYNNSNYFDIFNKYHFTIESTGYTIEFENTSIMIKYQYTNVVPYNRYAVLTSLAPIFGNSNSKNTDSCTAIVYYTYKVTDRYGVETQVTFGTDITNYTDWSV